MKLKTLLAVGLVCLAGISLQAQTNSTGSTILGYFTSFDTNKAATFGDHRFNLWTGVVSEQNSSVPLANDIGASYDFYRNPAPSTNLFTTAQPFIALELVARNSGVAGTLVSGQGGLQLGIIVIDTRLAFYVDGGYATANGGFKPGIYCETGIDVRKAITGPLYAGLRLGVQFGGGKTGQMVEALTGVTF